MLCYLWVAVLLALTTSVSAAETVLVVTDEWATFSNKDGSGYYFDIIHAVYPSPQFDVKIEFLPYARSLMLAMEGKADIVLGIYDSDVPNTQRSTYPIEIDSVDALTTPDIAQHWKGLESLSGKRVMARTDYGFDEMLPADAIYSEYHSLPSIVKMLVAGKIDAVLDYEADIEPIREETGLTDKFVYVRDVINKYVYIGFSKSRPELQQHFDQEYKKLYQSGKIREFILKNLGDDARLPKLEF
ncbi:hypothetical protein U14_01627 [Candidatus Moduliflexus flocculans]|uniref:Uncharacterized protein n=1 Tax=Candidatus Moduliflexus flocculans TaxID=1499966 RepID=A0A0S6VX08_9BACT|nr:hypothetical protein U14_01627 [Candidatus Moduliflexus flocculans]